jgi:hypothetical protein
LCELENNGGVLRVKKVLAYVVRLHDRVSSTVQILERELRIFPLTILPCLLADAMMVAVRAHATSKMVQRDERRVAGWKMAESECRGWRLSTANCNALLVLFLGARLTCET